MQPRRHGQYYLRCSPAVIGIGPIRAGSISQRPAAAGSNKQECRRASVADVRPQSSVLHPLDDPTQLGAIGLDNEVEPRNAFRLSTRASRIAIGYAAKGYRSISLEQIGPPLGSSSCVHARSEATNHLIVASARALSSHFGFDDEIAEIGSLFRTAFRPQGEQ